MRRSSDIRYPVYSAHSTAALLDRVQTAPAAVRLYWSPPPAPRGPGPRHRCREHTQLQRHSVGNRSWARPLVLSLQLQTPWSVIISRHRPRAYREELSLPGEQRTERWRQCDPGRSGDHARVRGHPDIA